jgi:hypothetical protein
MRKYASGFAVTAFKSHSMRVGSTIGGREGGTVAVALRRGVLGAAVAVAMLAATVATEVLAVGVATVGFASCCEQATSAAVAAMHMKITNCRSLVCTIIP